MVREGRKERDKYVRLIFSIRSKKKYITTLLFKEGFVYLRWIE